MAAIITDQLRILNSKNFVSALKDANNSFYSFIGLTNPYDYDSNWNVTPPSPKDNLDEQNKFWETIISLKKITASDVRHVIRKITWSEETVYDMYRHDISRTNVSNYSKATNLYASNFYVLNEDYRVYMCLNNGTDPEHPEGRPSLDQPRFTDLEPKSAGLSGDGYIWKYLFTIKPSDIVKFDSKDYIPIPDSWETNIDTSAVRTNAQTSGQLKVILIENRGVGLGTANSIYTNIPIKGDGINGEASIIIGNDSRVDSVVVTNGGSGYTYGILDYKSAGFPINIAPKFKVIIPPKDGHGFDIYKDLGAYNVMIFSNIENDLENPDFILENKVSRIGIIENPQAYDSTDLLDLDKSSAVGALKLKGTEYNIVSFDQNSLIYQTVGTGSTAVGRVISYNKLTGVLKYWQDRHLYGINYDDTLDTTPDYGFNPIQFTSNPNAGGSLNIVGNNGTVTLQIDNSFDGSSLQINNKTYNLGQVFNNGIANPEVKKYSGNIVYVDNRPPITRSLNQKELIKVILQF
jgi:hypothetical protein